MTNNRGFLVVFMILVGIGAVAGWFNLPKDEIIDVALSVASSDQFPKARPQDRSERLWRKISGEKLLVLRNSAEYVLIKPFWIDVDQHENIYVFDYGDLTLKKFSREGKFVRAFGKGKGKGPGEFMNPMNSAIDAEGKVWIADAVNVNITVFRADGVFEKMFRLKQHPERFLLLGRSGKFVVMPSSQVEDRFEVYDHNGQAVKSFGRLIPDQAQNWMALGGRAAADDSGRFVQVFTRAGYIVGYDSTGQLRFYRETIDPVPFPKLIVSEGGQGFDPKAPWASTTVNIVGDEVFVLSMSGAYKVKVGVIDSYSNQDGSYLYSFKLPDWATHAFVTKNHIYSVVDTTVTKWKR